MAIGRDRSAGGNEIPKRKVWQMNGEDPLEEIERRSDAIRLFSQDIGSGTSGGRLFVAGRETPVLSSQQGARMES